MFRPFLPTLVLLGACAARRGAPAVEPHLREAFARALQHLPAELVERTAGVTLVQRELEVPPGSPLIARLVARGALAYYSIRERELAVTSGGARGWPRWGEGAPEPGELDRFLKSIAPELDWETFAARVAGWSSELLAPGPSSPGDPRVLERFVALAGTRALGQDLPLEQLIFHELMHAVQLDGENPGAPIRAWSGAAGWLESDSGRVCDGSYDGAWRTERPEVLVRLVLLGERGRGAFLPTADFQCTNPYSAYDPREDYAESGRQMAYDPHALARAAPEKFLYLNALGWNARLDPESPGPRWYEPCELGLDLFERTVAAGGRTLWRRAEAQPGAPAVALAAVLRVHGRWLPPADYPVLELPATPRDLPPGVGAVPDLAFTVADGSRRVLPAPALVDRWDEGLRLWIQRREFTLGLLGWFPLELAKLETIEREEVLPLPGDQRRAFEAYCLLREAAGVWSAERLGNTLAREERAQLAGGRPLGAALLRLHFGTEPLEARVERALALFEAAGEEPVEHPFATVELGRGLVEALTDLDPERALQVARALPGSTWGAACRSAALLQLGDRRGALEAARGASLPGLRGRLIERISP
jgi:hypothetical protein